MIKLFMVKILKKSFMKRIAFFLNLIYNKYIINNMKGKYYANNY